MDENDVLGEGAPWANACSGWSISPPPLKGILNCSCARPFQDALRRRSLRRSSALSSMKQPSEEESRKVPELSAHAPACPMAQEGPTSSPGSISRSPLSPLSEPTSEMWKTTPSSPPHLSGKGLLPRGSSRRRDLEEDSPAVDSGPEADGMLLKFSLPGGSARPTQERLERTFTRQGSQPLPLR